MKNVNHWVIDLTHWADMAALTSEQVSCLSTYQLRELAKLLEDALTRNSEQAAKIGIYERIYGPLRECPGEASIYPVGQHTHGCKTFYCLSGHHHIGEYMFGPDQINTHTHSVTGGKNDA